LAWGIAGFNGTSLHGNDPMGRQEKD